MRGADYFWAAAGVAVLVVGYEVVKGGLTVGQAVGKFFSGLSFDTSSLGQSPQLTPAANLSRQQYIDMGYLVVNPDGSTSITAAGNAYIARQQQAAASQSVAGTESQVLQP